MVSAQVAFELLERPVLGWEQFRIGQHERSYVRSPGRCHRRTRSRARASASCALSDRRPGGAAKLGRRGSRRSSAAPPGGVNDIEGRRPAGNSRLDALLTSAAGSSDEHHRDQERGAARRHAPGGWSNELRPDDCVHTLIAVHTDEGVIGLGSVFTSDALVRGALAAARTAVSRRERARARARQRETASDTRSGIGRGGSITHTISGIDIALWDMLGKATGQPVGRLLGGRYRERVQPYASLLMEDPARWPSISCASEGAGLPRLQDRLGTVWPRHAATGRSDRSARARGDWARTSLLMVDAGASDAFWPNGYKWALRTAEMLADYDVALVRGSAASRRA